MSVYRGVERNADYLPCIHVIVVMLTLWPLTGVEAGCHVQINNVCSPNPFASISTPAVRRLVLTLYATGVIETASRFSFTIFFKTFVNHDYKYDDVKIFCLSVFFVVYFRNC